MEKTVDILCVGETLIDFIGHQMDARISETKDYHRYLGGSPTNVAMNMARLGMHTAMVASVGKDGFGEYILDKFKTAGIDASNVRSLHNTPTTVIFVSKTTGTPDFIPYRQADQQIHAEQLPAALLGQTKVFHTTAFALSGKPSQQTIISKAKEANGLGAKLSIDVNYAERVWPDRMEAMRIIKEYCSLDPLVKVSEDDMARLFDKELSHQEIFDFFHQLGVTIVCLTLGSKGVKLSQKGKEPISLPAIKIEKVMDATGAGDAFWSGFLFAYIKDKTTEQCLKTALMLAALKLQNVGRLPENVDVLSELLKIT
ncbi:carbohydrate kinase family protein [Sungkyunkwania multivorans]|uniref:Carbohydrate kinase family protein n=1 Tax=Sungkyunkwania multivorans TaxID=1173618 RepID=A0ABW3CUM9_9FLAO